jgi:hypothetical protein
MQVQRAITLTSFQGSSEIPYRKGRSSFACAGRYRPPIVPGEICRGLGILKGWSAGDMQTFR